MLLKVLLGIALLLLCYFVPCYIKAFWPAPSKRSLKYKMICSTLFVCAGILAMLIAKNYTEYAITIVIGLCLGWIGDYFLHAKSTMQFFITGAVFFLLGHIGYIVAFTRASMSLDSNYKLISLPEVLAFAVIFAVLGLLMVFKYKFKFANALMVVEILIYGTFLITMFIKATALSITYLIANGINGIVMFIILFAGALMFMLSDYTLGMILLGGQRENKPLKTFNVITYFAAQAFIALTVLFVAI